MQKAGFPPKSYLTFDKKALALSRAEALNRCLSTWTSDPIIVKSGTLHAFLGLQRHTPRPRRNERLVLDSKRRSKRSGARSRTYARGVTTHSFSDSRKFPMPNPLAVNRLRPLSSKGAASPRVPRPGEAGHTVTLGSSLNQPDSKEWRKFPLPQTPPCLRSDFLIASSSRKGTATGGQPYRLLRAVPEHRAEDGPEMPSTRSDEGSPMRVSKARGEVSPGPSSRNPRHKLLTDPVPPGALSTPPRRRSSVSSASSQSTLASSASPSPYSQSLRSDGSPAGRRRCPIGQSLDGERTPGAFK